VTPRVEGAAAGTAQEGRCVVSSDEHPSEIVYGPCHYHGGRTPCMCNPMDSQDVPKYSERDLRRAKAEAWDAGCSRAMRYMSDEPSLSLVNPYRNGGAS
jgi:hypothetical protein